MVGLALACFLAGWLAGCLAAWRLIACLLCVALLTVLTVVVAQQRVSCDKQVFRCQKTSFLYWLLHLRMLQPCWLLKSCPQSTALLHPKSWFASLLLESSQTLALILVLVFESFWSYFVWGRFGFQPTPPLIFGRSFWIRLVPVFAHVGRRFKFWPNQSVKRKLTLEKRYPPIVVKIVKANNNVVNQHVDGTKLAP